MANLSIIKAQEKLNQLLLKQQKLLTTRQRLLNTPVLSAKQVQQYSKVVNQLQGVNQAIARTSSILKAHAERNFAVGFATMAGAATAGSAAIVAAMVKAEAHFNPGAVQRYQIRLGDLQGVLGELGDRGFRKLSDQVYGFSKFLKNLGPGTRAAIDAVTEMAVPVAALGAGFLATTLAGRLASGAMATFGATPLAGVAAARGIGRVGAAAGLAGMSMIGSEGGNLGTTLAGLALTSRAASGFASNLAKAAGTGLKFAGMVGKATNVVGWGILAFDAIRGFRTMTTGDNGPARPEGSDRLREVRQLEDIADAGRRHRAAALQQATSTPPETGFWENAWPDFKKGLSVLVDELKEFNRFNHATESRLLSKPVIR